MSVKNWQEPEPLGVASAFSRETIKKQSEQSGGYRNEMPRPSEPIKKAEQEFVDAHDKEEEATKPKNRYMDKYSKAQTQAQTYVYENDEIVINNTRYSDDNGNNRKYNQKSESGALKDLLSKFNDVDIMSLIPLFMGGGDSGEIISKLLASGGKASGEKENMISNLMPLVPLLLSGFQNNKSEKKLEQEKVISLKDYRQI